MTREFDTTLLSRVEDAGINASAPREQRWIDGWLVRFSPGKAKRARCIQAVAAGRLPVEAKLELCQALYARAGLPLFVRVTPFSQPPGLDGILAELGMARIDDTRVMVAVLDPGAAASVDAGPEPGARIEPCDGDAYAEWVGGQRGSSATERRAHAQRLRDSPVDYRASLLIDASGVPVSGGQVAIEADMAGLYDIFTAPSARNRGLARMLCRRLLTVATGEGVRTCYLQVEADNAPARRIYRALGFADAYAYHYRSLPVA